MSGIISPFGKSGVITDVRGLTIRAYCRVTSDNPSSSAFDRSYNVASISHNSTGVTINLIEPIFNPYGMLTQYQWSTGNYWHAILGDSQGGLKTSIEFGYRKITQGATATVNDSLNGATISVYGGI